MNAINKEKDFNILTLSMPLGDFQLERKLYALIPVKRKGGKKRFTFSHIVLPYYYKNYKIILHFKSTV